MTPFFQVQVLKGVPRLVNTGEVWLLSWRIISTDRQTLALLQRHHSSPERRAQVFQLQPSITQRDPLLQRGQLLEKSPSTILSQFMIACQWSHCLSPSLSPSRKHYSSTDAKSHTEVWGRKQLSLSSLDQTTFASQRPVLHPRTHISATALICFQAAFRHQAGQQIRKGNNQ